MPYRKPYTIELTDEERETFDRLLCEKSNAIDSDVFPDLAEQAEMLTRIRVSIQKQSLFKK